MAPDLRDPRATDEHFANLIATFRKAVEVGRADAENIQDKRNNPVRYANHAHLYQSAAFVVANAMYSSGAPISEVAEAARELLRAQIMRNRAESDLGTGPAGFEVHRAQYVDALEVLSLGILVEIPTGELEEFVATRGSQGMDAVYDFLVSSATGSASDPARGSVIWPKPYAGLLEVTRAEPDRRPGLMREFLKRWYNQNRGAVWWGTHLQLKTGRTDYSGYWCYEAAAVTKLLRIDDSSYRDNEYYPRDLVVSRKAD